MFNTPTPAWIGSCLYHVPKKKSYVTYWATPLRVPEVDDWCLNYDHKLWMRRIPLDRCYTETVQ
jgi:hypothetical protein